MKKQNRPQAHAQKAREKVKTYLEKVTAHVAAVKKKTATSQKRLDAAKKEAAKEHGPIIEAPPTPVRR